MDPGPSPAAAEENEIEAAPNPAPKGIPTELQGRLLRHLTRESLRTHLEDPSWSPFEGVHQSIWLEKESEAVSGTEAVAEASSSKKGEWDNRRDWKWDNIDQSPHSWQSDPKRQKAEVAASYSVRRSRVLSRALDHEAGECQEYRRRNQEVKTVLHWGQRKLLLSEIELLSLALDENMRVLQPEPSSNPGEETGARKQKAIGTGLVVYAGAAPGTHIEYLARLFPQADFDLVDPAPFRARPQAREDTIGNIRIHQGLFTDELANSYAQRVSPIAEDGSIVSTTDEDGPKYPMVVFLSDIRSADWERMSAEETDNQVRMDMERQMVWVETMKPDMSLLKFRLSWTPGQTEYLNGTILFPIWGPVTTTEARLLVPRDIRRVHYDNTRYEQQMFFFNTTIRPTLYPHLFPGKLATDEPVSGQATGEKRKAQDGGSEQSNSKRGGASSAEKVACSSSTHPTRFALDSKEGPEDEGLDHCYDCTAEIHVLARYLAKFHSEWALGASWSEWKARIHQMAVEISKQLCNTRTLRSPNCDPQDRKRGIHRRQYIQGKPAYEIAMNMTPSSNPEHRFNSHSGKEREESHKGGHGQHRGSHGHRHGHGQRNYGHRRDEHKKGKSGEDKE